MMDSIEPLSWIIWAIAAFAAGLYPLGILLPGCQCCGSDCDDPIEFVRCVRFAALDQSPLPTTYSSLSDVTTPLRGFSQQTSRPEDIGAVRVPTHYAVNGLSLGVARYSARLSDGESESATFSLRYGDSTSPNSKLAFRYNVTIQGVTVPLLNAPQDATWPSNPTFEYTHDPWVSGQPATCVVSWTAGNPEHSVNAPASASVYDAYITDGREFFDGTVTNAESLKAAASATYQPSAGETWVSVSIPSHHFKYMPAAAGSFSTARVVFVIKQSRGNKHTYTRFTFTVNMFWETGVSPPTGGLTAPVFAPLAYSNDEMPSDEPVFGQIDRTVDPPTMAVTVKSHAGLTRAGCWAYGTHQGCVPLPELDLYPTGPALSEWQVLLASFTPSLYVTPAFERIYDWILTNVTVKKRGYIIRLKYQSETLADWNYDVSEVSRFLKGEATLQGQKIGTDAVLTSYSASVTEPTRFCGERLCGVVAPGQTDILSSAIASTVTATLPKQPQTQTSFGEKGSVTQTNLCFGQDARPVVSMRRNGCVYYGQFSTCATLNSAVGYSLGGGYYVNTYGQGQGGGGGHSPQVAVQAFYCGDLLWAIENGPCRSSLTVSAPAGMSSEYSAVYQIGGDDSASFRNRWQCATPGGPVDHNGKCPPVEATVSLSRDYYISRGPNLVGDFSTLGKIIPGDYVMSLVGYADLTDTNCNQQVFSLDFPLQSVDQRFNPVVTNGPVTHRLSLFRRRKSWCDPWDGYWGETGVNSSLGKYSLFQSSCFYAIAEERVNPCPNCFPLTWGNCNTFVPMSAVTFGEQSDPYDIFVAASPSSVPREGGSVTLSYCCPQRIEQRNIPPHDSINGRVLMLAGPTQSNEGRGSTAYISQPGYADECPFGVTWLSGFAAPEQGNPNIHFLSAACPIKGQVGHKEQPPCEWMATTSASWLVASETDDGLLTLRIDSTQPESFPQTVFYQGTKLGRTALLTVTSGGSVLSWTIVQLQP